MPDKNLHKIAYLIPAVGLLIFGYFGAQSFADGYAAYSAQSWPTTNGTIVRSEWKRYTGKGCHFGLILQYAYAVDGIGHIGGTYRFGGECGASAMKISADHPVGASVVVHYKTGAPERSVISPGDLALNTKLGLVLWPVMVLLSLYLFWQFRGRMRPSGV